MERPGPQDHALAHDSLARLRELDALTAAPLLLGARIERRLPSGEQLVARIVETEAYLGAADAASHAARGPTPRNAVMFGEGGFAYVYFTYGMHHCFNVVCGARGEAGAVLVRAAEPLRGRAAMAHLRKRAPEAPATELASGPGKLCQALAIDRTLNGHDLAKEPLRLRIDWGAEPAGEVASGPRVGIRLARDLPWRFWLRGNPHVSR